MTTTKPCGVLDLESRMVCHKPATKLVKVWNAQEFPCCDEHVKAYRKEANFQYARAIAQINGAAKK